MQFECLVVAGYQVFAVSVAVPCSVAGLFWSGLPSSFCAMALGHWTVIVFGCYVPANFGVLSVGGEEEVWRMVLSHR